MSDKTLTLETPGARFSKVLRTFRFQKPIRKTSGTAYSVKLVFSHVVKEIKLTIKITANFLASRRLRFEDTKRMMSPEIRPKSFGPFEKQAPASFSFYGDNLVFINLLDTKFS